MWTKKQKNNGDSSGNTKLKSDELEQFISNNDTFQANYFISLLHPFLLTCMESVLK